jgi:hypothetical protein
MRSTGSLPYGEAVPERLRGLEVDPSSNSGGCSTGSSDGVNKANQAKAITRHVFRAPGTVCQ